MCTTTINRSQTGLLVTMSRDEARTRPPELPPMPHQAAGLHWEGPIDPPSGGTWFGANEAGLVGCLLNGYVAEDFEVMAAGIIKASRGLVIPALMACRTVREALDYLESPAGQALTGDCLSFRLVLADRERSIEYQWLVHGEASCLELPGEWVMRSSSFWNQDAVIAYREERFREWLAAGAGFRGDLPGLHLQREPGWEEWAVLMDRDFSSTRSISQVSIGPQGPRRMRYWLREGETELREWG